MQVALQQKRSLEARIVDLLLKGDQGAISLIYKNYSVALYGVIYKIVESESYAQEILQDCFVKVWRNASRYDPTKGRIFTWLVNIARNTAIDKVRSAPFKQIKQEQSITNFHILQKEIGLSYITIEDSGLRKIIASLDEKHRTLIDLVYFQGYSQREIEKELMIPLGTVKSRIRTAIIALRGILNSEQQLLQMTA